jgi:hypothetical protein
MALVTDSVAAMTGASSPCTRLRESGRNDAFTFWKLPEDHRQALAAATDYSELLLSTISSSATFPTIIADPLRR